MNSTVKKGLLLAGLIVAAGALEVPFGIGIVVPESDARVGRPLTPGSVAGVARRTTRRTIRRRTVIIATLPVGCRTVVIEGMTLHQCGTVYYQPSGGQYVVVEVH